jgi:hypothetical protein
MNMDNPFDGLQVNQESFAYRDLTQQDRWQTGWTPAFTSLTTVGALTTTGRFRLVGKQCYFQVTLVAATSIASTAGSTYLTLPVTANAGGLAGMATMTNETTDIAVGVCHVSPSNSRCYVPSQSASGNTFTIAGFYEVK